MPDSRADRPTRGAGPAALARAWLGTLARLVLFGLIYVPLATIVAVLIHPLIQSEPARLAGNGLASLVGALVAGAVVLRSLERRSWRALGIAPDRAALRYTAVGLGFGLAMIAATVLLMAASGDLRFRPDAGSAADATLAAAAGLAVFTPLAAAEEALFRGYPIQTLARTGGVPLAILTTSTAFAAVHGNNESVGPLALANILLAGILLAVVYLRTASLWAATAVHLGWNWGMGALFDLPISGYDWVDVPAVDAALVGPVWWNGGAFGPEGGVIGTIVFVGATVLALRTPWLRRDPRPDARAVMLHERPAES